MEVLDDRHRIIEVASPRFFELGLSKVTLDELAGELGMSKKTMYKIFPSKEFLFRSVVHDMMESLGGKVEKLVAADMPFIEKISGLMELLGRQLGGVSKPFMSDLQRFMPDLWQEMESFRRERILTNIRLIFDQGKREGLIRRDLELDLFLLVFRTSVEGIVNPHVLATQAFSAEQALQGIFKILFSGAMTDEARRKFSMITIS